MEPPAKASYLDQTYEGKQQRGGTLLVPEVWDFAEHEWRLCQPDRYRPEVCRNCGCGRLHAHDFRHRWLRDLGREVKLRRFLCAACRAVWQVLPSFVPRFLQRSWRALEHLVTGGSRVGPLPAATQQRLRGRLGLCGLVLMEFLCACGVLLQGAGSGTPTRGEVVQRLVEEGAVSERTALHESAVLVHRLVPGVRLM